MGGKTLNHGSPMDSITFKNYQVNVTFVIQFALLHMPFHSQDQERSLTLLLINVNFQLLLLQLLYCTIYSNPDTIFSRVVRIYLLGQKTFY